MMKSTVTVLEENIELVEALAAAHNVDIEVVAEYDDMLEIDVEGDNITEFIAVCNTL